MIEIILLVIAVELLMVMSFTAVCLTIFLVGKKRGVKQMLETEGEVIEEERKRAEKLQKQFENMMAYTGRERADED